ncbi:hypothetical protein [uncultured Microbacterium sp.]|uniref:hypothetical protein n=1 Tax=uncultured Microbacterium sp. TaxID=191216 RepID=UPI0028E1ADE4|nr:hypothetical protein [uncultured Microbacterium sp.]
MTTTDLIALVALVVSLVALIFTGWQVVRQEKDVARRAWSRLHVDHGEVAKDRGGVEIELSIAGRSVLYEVVPFTHGGMILHEMSDRVSRLTCESDPIKFVLDVSLGDDADPNASVGVTWLTPRRWGRIHVEEALRVNVRTGEVQHWIWSPGPVPLTWRRNPKGRWGTRPVRLGLANYYVPDVAESMFREREREGRLRTSRTWPPQ